MPYNSEASEKNYVGIEISDDLLNVAQAIIHHWSQLRWETTAVVRRFSGNNNRCVFLNYPITTWNYLKEIDQENSTETTLTRYSDYDLDEEIGKLDAMGGSLSAYFPPTGVEPIYGFVKGYNNYEVSYSYGYTSSHYMYPIIRMIEASIALELKKNPLLLQSVRLTGGDTVNYGNDGIYNLLKNIPQGKGTGQRL